MPLTREHRLIFLDGTLIASSPYWETMTVGPHDGPPTEPFATVAEGLEARLFSMDVAKLAGDRGWKIVELGDGQTAGLPPTLTPEHFYAALANGLTTRGAPSVCTDG